jgi:NAD(P)-dependent dehydrogenase (short-subunit alcohol dehydrogenase family)
LRENGQDCRAVQMDVTDPASVSRAFEEIAEISGAAPDIGP